MTTASNEPQDPGETEALARAAGRRPGPEAFTELYARVAPALYAWARLRVRPSLRELVDPEDLVQEICCRAFERFAHYDADRGRFRAWLFGIAQNTLQSALVELGRARRAGPREGLRESRVIDALPEDATSISQRVARDESIAHLVGWLEELEEEERRLIVHRGLEGRMHEEVAELLGLSHAAAKKRWTRLCERLRERGVPGDWLVD